MITNTFWPDIINVSSMESQTQISASHRNIVIIVTKEERDSYKQIYSSCGDKKECCLKKERSCSKVLGLLDFFDKSLLTKACKRLENLIKIQYKQ